MRVTDPELTPVVVKLYRKLGSTPKVARRLGMSGHATVRRILIRAGIKLPKPNSPEVLKRHHYRFNGKQAKIIARAYQAGMPMNAMQRKYRCSRWAIHSAARKYGIALRPVGGPPRRIWTVAQKREICRLYARGWTQIAIAARFDSCQRFIRAALASSGVQTFDFRARGKRHGAWRGGRTVSSEGYVRVLVDPEDVIGKKMITSSDYVLEHRLVVARSLGRPLKHFETVHHINGKRDDNRLENLQLRHGKHGNGSAMRCADCGSHNLVYEALE